MDDNETAMLTEVREAMQDPNVSLHLRPTFTHGTGVQVQVKTRKIGPIFFPNDGETVADVLHLLGTMAAAES